MTFDDFLAELDHQVSTHPRPARAIGIIKRRAFLAASPPVKPGRGTVFYMDDQEDGQTHVERLRAERSDDLPLLRHVR